MYEEICSPESPSYHLCGKHFYVALRGIYRRDVSSNLETTGQSHDRVLHRKVSSSDETVGARVFIAGQ